MIVPQRLFLFVLGFWMAWERPVRAADVERREYSILIDGKEAGLSRMTITAQDDGVTVVTGMAQVKFSHLLVSYNLNVEVTEWWKDATLIGLKAQTIENNRKTEIVAVPSGGKLQARVNGKERLLAAETWSSSFWKLADPRFHNKAVPVLEPDTGKDYLGQLQYIGTEQLTLLGQPQSCYHFRVSGGPNPVDVWFDRYHRLVRQEFMKAGHKTIVQLISVKR